MGSWALPGEQPFRWPVPACFFCHSTCVASSRCRSHFFSLAPTGYLWSSAHSRLRCCGLSAVNSQLTGISVWHCRLRAEYSSSVRGHIGRYSTAAILAPLRGMLLFNCWSPNKSRDAGGPQGCHAFVIRKSLERYLRQRFSFGRILQSFDNSETNAGLSIGTF